MADAAPATPFAARLDEILTSLTPRLRQLADELHDHPETAYEEHESVARIIALLAEYGVTAEGGTFGLPTSFRALAGSGEPRVAILAEYDALPEIGQACGHNLIAAGSIGAFLAAKAVLEEEGISGTIELIGTPAEEGGGGKQKILDAGGFEGITAAMMVHPGRINNMYSTGLGMRHVEAVYRGVESHASSSPARGYNALDAAVTAYQSIAQARQHTESADRVHGIFTDGGQAPNIVPGRAALHYFVRSASIEGLEALSSRVDAALQGAAVSTQTEADITWDSQPAYLPVKANIAIADRFVANMAGKREFPPASTASAGGGSTDMGNVTQVIPGIHPTISTTSQNVVGHSSAFTATTLLPEATAGFVDSAFGLAATTLDILRDLELREAIAAEFAAGDGA